MWQNRLKYQAADTGHRNIFGKGVHGSTLVNLPPNFLKRYCILINLVLLEKRRKGAWTEIVKNPSMANIFQIIRSILTIFTIFRQRSTYSCSMMVILLQNLAFIHFTLLKNNTDLYLRDDLKKNCNTSAISQKF